MARESAGWKARWELDFPARVEQFLPRRRLIAVAGESLLTPAALSASVKAAICDCKIFDKNCSFSCRFVTCRLVSKSETKWAEWIRLDRPGAITSGRME